jgi:predicted HTH transcriptional regulator
VEIRENQTIFFNPGKSLVPFEGLLDGGKSTSRNPVVSRALRLIGFAELAGSGLYVVRNEWRKTRGVAPKLESSPEANTFTLTFDWVPSAERVDEFWKEKLGVKLTPEQARLLPLLASGPLSIEKVASVSGLSLPDTQAAVDYLKIQALVVETMRGLALRSDLPELIASRKKLV